MVSIFDAAIGRTTGKPRVHHDERVEGGAPLEVTPDASLGGYFEKHSRPPAFQGSDGASYSVDVYIEENQTGEAKYSAALIFVRWSADGAQPVGHLETEHLAQADRRTEAKAALYALSLHDVKEHLERVIRRKQELPDW